MSDLPITAARFGLRVLGPALIAGTCLAGAERARDVPPGTAIHDRMAQIAESGQLSSMTTASSGERLGRFYRTIGFRRAWTDPQAVRSLRAAVAAAHDGARGPGTAGGARCGGEDGNRG